jgi:hypothetical protein
MKTFPHFHPKPRNGAGFIFFPFYDKPFQNQITLNPVRRQNPGVVQD